MIHFAFDPSMTDADWEAAKRLAEMQREMFRAEQDREMSVSEVG